ncbi:MAG: hypothetical protein IJ746_06115 [Ruminococcus sp.]|nr:hypothetical protein [Ruminococcus sp.]
MPCKRGPPLPGVRWIEASPRQRADGKPFGLGCETPAFVLSVNTSH